MTTSNDVPPAHVRALQRALVEQLVAGGELRSRAWREAFERVPRHLFLPHIYRRLPQAGRYQPLDSARPDQREEWLRLVYTDDTCATQLAPADGHSGATDEVVEGMATSSSTTPSLMAAMLEALDVTADHTVLEIGTGTGYNAALLCERLGSDNVTTIDVDAALVGAARSRLGALGYTPTIAVAEGIEGYPSNAPYDRILATCSVTHIPRTWTDQTRTAGMILTGLYRELGGGPLVRLTVHPDGTAHGRVLPTYASFMPLRPYAVSNALELLEAVPDQAGDSRSTSIGGSVFDDNDFVFFAAHHLPDASYLQVEDDEAGWQPWLLTSDGSWAYQTVGTQDVPIAVQGGPRRLWDAVEDAFQQWTRLDRPHRERFGLTVTSDRQYMWLDTPDCDHTWDLPGRPWPTR